MFSLMHIKTLPTTSTARHLTTPRATPTKTPTGHDKKEQALMPAVPRIYLTKDWTKF